MNQNLLFGILLSLPRPAHRDKEIAPDVRLTILAELTRQAAARGAALIVWPEMGLGFDPQVEHTAELRDLARESRAYLVIGYVVEGGDGFRNQAVLLSPEGEFLGIQSKTHPMIVSGELKSAGAGEYPFFNPPIGRLGMMICFDASFTDVARKLGGQGAQVIANPSLFGPSIASLTQVMPVFRAIENGAAMVMADVAYNSMIVDSYGRVVAALTLLEGQQGILLGEVHFGTGNTLYTRLGDWLGWVSLISALAFAIAIPLNERK